MYTLEVLNDYIFKGLVIGFSLGFGLGAVITLAACTMYLKKKFNEYINLLDELGFPK